MRIEWQVAPMPQWEADVIVFFFFEDFQEPLPYVQKWGTARDPQFFQSIFLKDFTGKLKETAVFYSASDEKMPRVICAGLGPRDQFDLDKLRNATASAFRKGRELKLKRIAIPLSALEDLSSDLAASLEESLIAGLSSLYKYNGFKTTNGKGEEFPQEIVLCAEKNPGEDLRALPDVADATMAGIKLARDLVSAPANKVTPSHLAKVADRLAQRHGHNLNIIDYGTAESMGMGAFTAVARGSREPAFLIVLEHAPAGLEHEKPLVFVGKGITFDTGGISIKPSDKMEAMKQDMAGAAAVLSLFEILGRLKIRRRVVGILPCTENMPGGQAYKPGDVIHSLSGLTIEVISTDAEGRMVLCDALAYAKRYEPALIVDIATLTGACIVALGNQVAAVMGNNDKLTDWIRSLGLRVGEKFWPLPLWDLYFESIKSEVADFKNVGDRSAGAIVGGVFLKQFVANETPWAHLDIAGTAWTSKDLGTIPQGATGFGVRTLMEIIRRWEESSL